MTIDWGAATLVAGSATTIAGVFAKARIDRQHLVAQRATGVEGDALLQLQERLGTLPDAYYGILNHAEEIVQNPTIEQGQFDDEDVYPFVYEADRTPLVGPPAMRAWVGWCATAERTRRG